MIKLETFCEEIVAARVIIQLYFRNTFLDFYEIKEKVLKNIL